MKFIWFDHAYLNNLTNVMKFIWFDHAYLNNLRPNFTPI